MYVYECLHTEKQTPCVSEDELGYVRVTHKFQYISNMWDCHRNNRYKIKWKTGSISCLIQTPNSYFISHVYLIQKKYFEIDNICTFIGLNFSRYLNRQLVCSAASQKQEMFMSLLGNEGRTQLNIVQGCIRLTIHKTFHTLDFV